MDLSIKSIKENWNKKSTAQKVGTVAAGVAGAAAVAVTTAAAVRGGKLHKVDSFVKEGDKYVAKNADAAKEAKFADKIKGAWNTLVDGFKSIFIKENREAYKTSKVSEEAKAINKQLSEAKKAEKAAKKAADKTEAPKAEQTNNEAPAPEVKPEGQGK